MLAHDLDPPLPPLNAVVTSPIFTAEGRLIDRPGYDPKSGILARFNFAPRPVSAKPTAAEITEARQLLDKELLGDFPFESPADLATTVGLGLGPLVRPMIDGPTPLIDVSGSMPGAGKGLLVKSIFLPTQGAGVLPSDTLAKEDAELRKALTTMFREKRNIVLFDNVAGYLYSSVLAKVLTDDVWSDRLLGVNRSVKHPVRVTWVMTSNNLSYNEEIGRRTVPIRLVPETEHPEQEGGRWILIVSESELDSHVTPALARQAADALAAYLGQAR